MKLVVLHWTWSDGYTFSAMTFLGVFETEEDARAAAEFHFNDEQNRYNRPDSLDGYETSEIEVGALVDLG